jgi:DNA primase small subunit
MTEGTAPATAAAEAPKAAAPTEFPPPVKATVHWLNDMFAEWYRRNPPPMPDRFTRREFGYILWPERPGTPPFIRHKAYDNADRFHWYLQKAGPHSVYYSTAYYRRPGEMKMLDKQWIGAELIFDLDADHLAEAEDAKKEGRELPLGEQLSLVKTEFKRLLDKFLFGDFGLTEKDVWITFSGGRGYHAHVVQEKLLQLGNRERREIVDYIRGKFPSKAGTKDLDMDSIWRRVPIGFKKFGDHVTPHYRYEVPSADSPGWGGRLSSAVWASMQKHVIDAPEKEALDWLMAFEGIGHTKAKKLYDHLSAEKLRRIDKGVRRDAVGTRPAMVEGPDIKIWSEVGLLPGGSDFTRIVYEQALKQEKIELEGETDEPVTADTKRLIRLPGSLHGKSGLKVVTLTRDTLDGFDPLRDAVAFPMEPTRIIPRNDATATLGGETVSVKQGEPVDVPLPHAVFWLARQGGVIVKPG